MPDGLGFPARGPADDILARVRDFLRQGAAAGTHPGKLLVLSRFMEDVFGVQLEELLPGIEARVGSKILGARGAIDLLYSAAVIELKTNYGLERDEAIKGLTKYFQSLHEAYPERRYIGLATDLVRFELFAPKLKAGRVIHAELIDAIDTRRVSEERVLLWIDAVLFAGHAVIPTADELGIKFGPSSATFATATEALSELWSQISAKNSSQLKLRIWSRITEIVYGAVPPEDAFVAQTYLSVLAKILVFLKLSGAPLSSNDQVRAVLNGRYFIEHGIANLIEEDFFAWILDPDIAPKSEEVTMALARALRVYDLERADEDLFKELYQRILGIHARHGAGEYYTPRWLCEYTLDRVLTQWKKSASGFPRLLDPACGSGSFLTAAIHSLREAIKKEQASHQLESILQHVSGIDFNPIAVTIARANYIIALGDLLEIGERIVIPVFVADSIKLPQLHPTVYGKLKAYDLEVDGEHLVLPESILTDSGRRVRALNLLQEAIAQYSRGTGRADVDAYFFREAAASVSNDEAEVLKATLSTLLDMIDDKANSIWLFVLNNLYTPVMVQRSPFDVIIGNPPWLVMHSIENRDYQDFLKAQVLLYKLLAPEQTELYTHMEMATLFFRKACHLYLRDAGLLGFVMPTSITTGAFHHQNFNRFDTPATTLLEISRFNGVPGIFSLPPCVLVAKKGGETKFPVPVTDWKGSLTGHRRNAPLSEILPILTGNVGTYTPPKTPMGLSPYFSLFKEGATLVPRNFWFVEARVSDRLGGDRLRPMLKTSSEAERVAKRPWKGLKIEGQVETRFIFACYLGKDLIPFGTLPPRPVVLPLVERKGAWNLWDVDKLRSEGYPLAASWVEKAQQLWEAHRSERSKSGFPRVINRLDYQHTLTHQTPPKRYVVAYNGRGADAMASTLDRGNLPSWSFGRMTVRPAGFVADSTNFYYETNSIGEAHFLCAVLNAPSINAAVKPFQPRGAYGPRDIGRRSLRLSIPQFDPSNSIHTILSGLSREAHAVVAGLTFSGSGFRTRRREATEALESQLGEIDQIVESLGMPDVFEAAPGLALEDEPEGTSEFDEDPDNDR